MPATKGSSQRPAHYEDARVRIEKLIVGPFENNVFVVRCKGTGEAVIIDAANEHELLLEVSRRPACGACSRRTATATTSRPSPRCATPASTWASPADDAAMLPAYDFVIPDDEVIEVGDLRLRTIHNPGPHPGLDVVPAGGSPDRCSAATRSSPAARATPSFAGGDFDRSSSRSTAGCSRCPADMLVLPGHGLDTTIGTERRTSRSGSTADFSREVPGRRPE